MGGGPERDELAQSYRTWEKHPWVFEWIFDRFFVPEVDQESPKKMEEMVLKQVKYMSKKDRRLWRARRQFRDR